MGLMSAATTEHLRTDHLIHDLGKRAISGGFVTVAAQGAKFFLNLASAVVLARLLSPRDFGLVGMVLAVTGLLRLFKEAGLSTATVQRETISQEQVSNLFWINVALGSAACFVSIGLAPLVASFYHDSRLTGVMMVLSFTFLFGGLTVQHQALLTRQLRFKAVATIDVVSMLASIVTGCCMALLGFAYWALVGMQLCLAGTTLVLTWWVSGWHPTMPKRRSGVLPLLTFGAHLTASDLVALLAVNSDSILIGRFFGAVPLGLYSRANVLLARPLDQLLAPLNAVLTPVLSRLQSDPERYRRTFLRAYETLALVTFPFAALCLVLAEPVVLLLLGPQWKGAVPLFAGFALVAVSLPLSTAPIWLFTSQGRGRDMLQNHTVLGAVTVGAYFVGLSWGPLGVVLALAVASLAIRLPILYHLAGRRGPVRSADLWKGFLCHLPCWGAVYAAASLAHTVLAQAAPLLQLVVCVPVGLAAGAGTTFALKRPRENALYAWHAVMSLLARAREQRRTMGIREAPETTSNGERPTCGSTSLTKRRTIALFGIFGVQNIGNECTLQAMLHNVRQRLPDAEIYSICYEPQDTTRRHQVTALPIRSRYSRVVQSVRPARPRNRLVRLLRRLFRRLPDELLDWFRAFKTLRGTDLLVMTGTGMLTDYSTSSFGYPYDVFKWTIAAKLARCKVRFVGIGVGPIYERLSRVFIKCALTVADYRSFRDEQSKTRLGKLGFDAAKDPVFPDLAFSLPQSIFPSHANHTRRERTVGLGVMRYVDPHTTPPHEGQAAYEAYLDKMSDFTVWLLEHNYKVRILQGDSKYDTSVRKDLRAKLEKRGFRYENGIIDEDIASVEDLLAQLDQADVVVSPRFHNLILALMLNKPVISLSYDPKNDTLLQGFGLGKYCQPVDKVDVDLLIDQFIDLEARIDEITPSLRQSVNAYRGLLEEQYRVILGDSIR